MTDTANTDQPSAFSQLTPKRQRFVKAYLANGGNGKQAAIEAGYSEKSAKSQAWSLLHRDEGVRAALKELADGVKKHALHDYNVAMMEFEEGMRLAEKTGQAMAYVRAAEMRARMAGLLIERQLVQVHNHVSLKEAIAEAHRRLGHEPPEDPTIESLNMLQRLPTRPAIDAEFSEILDLDLDDESTARQESIEPQTMEQNT